MAFLTPFGGHTTLEIDLSNPTFNSLLIPPPIEQSEPSTPPCVAHSSFAGLAEDELHELAPDAVRERSLKQIPGFLFSLILHLVLLVVLALIFQRTTRPDPIMITLASSASESPWPNADEPSYLSSVELTNAEPEIVARAVVVDEAVTVDLEDVSELEFESPFAAESNMQPVPIPPKGTEVAVDAPRDSEKREKKIEFFGAHAYGNSFVFVLDISASMAARNGQRLQRATIELMRSINQLNDEQNFSVVLYSERATPMFLEANQPRMRSATPKNKQAAIQWLKYQARPTGGTFPASALQIAGNMKPDAVFFLSDGEFVYGQLPSFGVELNSFLRGFGQARLDAPPMANGPSDPQSVLAAYDPKIVVHTIAFESTASRPLMERIANEKKGQHRFIPAP